MPMENIREEVKEEAEIIRHAGEIPEVAFWNSLHFLTEDPEGPKLKLSLAEEEYLKKAVIERYLLIIERDLTYENKGKSHYRGLERAIANWKRISSFAEREGFALEPLRKKVLECFQIYLKKLSEKEFFQEKEQLKELAGVLGISFNENQFKER